MIYLTRKKEYTAEIVHDDNSNHNDSSGFTTVITVTALILSIIALGLAWLAYNRAGEDLGTQVRQGVEQTAEEAGEAVQEGSDEVEQAIDEGPDGVDDGAR